MNRRGGRRSYFDFGHLYFESLYLLFPLSLFVRVIFAVLLEDRRDAIVQELHLDEKGKGRIDGMIPVTLSA